MAILPRPSLQHQTSHVTATARSPPSRTALSAPWLFGAVVAALVAKYHWAFRWLVSGAPILTMTMLLGASTDHRALRFVPLWTLLTTLHLAYAIVSTSWLLYGVFTALCYPTILLSALVQSSAFADFVRRYLRRILTRVQFVNDIVAYFDLPALEIDRDVFGLMVVRGITFQLSHLTLVAHGVEVGIMLSDDLELALQTEQVTVELFRRIVISPVYANIKGGAYEMTFGNLDTRATTGLEGDKLMVSDSALLQRASTTGDITRPPLIKMKSKLTNDAPMTDIGSRQALRSARMVSSDSTMAMRTYEGTVKWIEKTNMINQSRQAALRLREEQGDKQGSETYLANESDIKAAISTMLHAEPSVPHPPKASVKLTTLRNMSSARTKQLMHRLPLLLRVLLNPLSYLHPINIESIVAAGSGMWITAQLQKHVFKDYASENAELRRLENRVSSWLSDANFAVSLDNVQCQANVPLLSRYDIVCSVDLAEIRVHRTLHDDTLQVNEVVRMGGAHASFSIPSFLLPHHEHLLPPAPRKSRLVQNGVPTHTGTSPADAELRATTDEATVYAAVHARLPASLDQELLNFIAALVKATKVVELEREMEEGERGSNGAFREFAHNLNKGMRDGMKKVVAEGIVNDRWIAKMVGKITRKLQTASGELGYSARIPIALGPYRLPEGHVEAIKILE